jgi:hypothetical protein
MEDDMDGTCSMDLTERKEQQNIGRKTWSEETDAGCEDNIKMGLKEQDMKVWMVFIWVRTGSSAALLWTQ